MGTMRTLTWDAEHNQLQLIDQRRLPAALEVLSYSTAEEVAQAIRDMVVRGAPAIGVAAAYGLALAGLRAGAPTLPAWAAAVRAAGETLRAARPTAVNLGWALDRALEALRLPLGSIAEGQQALLACAHQMAEEDVAVNQRIARHGAALLEDGDTVIHHCNTGALATVDWGTALGVIRQAHEDGKRIHVLVDETRPRLQGARLTAWELSHYGIPYDIIPDNAAGYFLRTGQAHKVLFGADRVAANGDVANKVGSYMLALAAHDNGAPVYSVFPKSTVDFSLATGDQIPIEERDPHEVLGLQFAGEPVTPAGASARNPAFDVTPHRLLTGLITEYGVVQPPFFTNLARMLNPGRSQDPA